MREEEDDTFDDDLRVGDKLPNLGMPNRSSFFRRGIPSATSMSRLSAVIRRSLRLPSRSSRSTIDSRMNLQKFVDEEGGPRFTALTDLRALPYEAIPSRMTEIKEAKRTGKPIKIKQIIRKGNWPSRHEMRRELWKELCRDQNFDAAITVFNGEISKVTEEADSTNCNPYCLTEDGVVRLMRMLTVFENFRPDLTTAPPIKEENQEKKEEKPTEKKEKRLPVVQFQVLYPLCALFMHYMSDAEAYACAQYITRRDQGREGPVHLLMTQVEWDAVPHCLLALLKKYKPNSYAFLKKKCAVSDDEVLVEVMRDWRQWIFRDLPLSHIVRIVDCFLVEGHKFLLRTAIAIVYMWSKIEKSAPARPGLEEKVGAELIDSVKKEISAATLNITISIETFIEMAVMIKNFKSTTINRFQSMFEKKVKEADEARNSGQRAAANMSSYTKAFNSSIISKDAAKTLMAKFPPRLQLSTPELLFKLSQDGASFTHLWKKIDDADHTLFIIRTTKGDVFGAYCSACWQERNDRAERSKSKYFGTGESFLFRIPPKTTLPEIFQWAGYSNNNRANENAPQMFMTAADRLLVIGSGGGDAIRISEELTRGMSSSSTTFNSPPLVEERSFDIHELEVYGISSSTTNQDQ